MFSPSPQWKPSRYNKISQPPAFFGQWRREVTMAAIRIAIVLLAVGLVCSSSALAQPPISSTKNQELKQFSAVLRYLTVPSGKTLQSERLLQAFCASPRIRFDRQSSVPRSNTDIQDRSECHSASRHFD